MHGSTWLCVDGAYLNPAATARHSVDALNQGTSQVLHLSTDTLNKVQSSSTKSEVPCNAGTYKSDAGGVASQSFRLST
jgi:hypothetical protein